MVSKPRIPIHANLEGLIQESKGTLWPITEKNIQPIGRIGIEYTWSKEIDPHLLMACFKARAYEEGADAVINFRCGVRYGGWGFWKKPVSITVDGDAIKIYNT